jgi:vesicle coat complex subunit
VDSNAYVRKTGVMAVLKMHHLSPDLVRDMALVDTLYTMLQDVDTQVRAQHMTVQFACTCAVAVQRVLVY